MRNYEVMFIVAPMEDDATDAVIKKFAKLIADNGGTITKEDRWGRRRLAYPIKKSPEGYYCLFYVEAEPPCVKELDRVFKITETVLKHMIIRNDEPQAAEVAPPQPEEASAEEQQ